MPAFLKNLFKSKRPGPASSKPIAVENLDPSRAKDRETLFQLIIDPESSAHQINAALTKTGSLDVIVRWHAAAPPAIQTHIADWIARQTSNPKRLAQARGRLDDPQLQQVFDKLTGSLVEQASSPAGTPSRSGLQVEQLAVQAKTSQARQNAVDQINDEAALQRIVKAAKGRDKRVYQIARQKLQTLREEAAKAAAVRAEIEKILEQCEAHARTESTKLYQPRFESLLIGWESLQAAATPEEEQRFLAARALCQSRCDELAAQARLEAEALARAEERAATLALLKETIEQLKQATPEQIPSVSSLDAMQKTQENRWLEATRDVEVDSREQQAYEQLMQSLRLYLEAHRRLETHQAELQAALETTSDEDHSSTLRALVKTIAWPAGYSLPTVLSTAASRLKSAPREAPAAASRPEKSVDTSQLQTLLDSLQEVLEQKELKPSRKLLKEVQQASESLTERARRPFQARIALLTRQMQDLQDWQGFATRPKQEALCQQMELLAEQHLEPELKAAKIHELQEQWRELGGSSDQLLWQRFKQAADAAFAPCQDYFAARNELKAANLHKREQICDELSMFISGVDWTGCDWRAVEKIHRQARQEWREAKPIDFRRNRNVQRRFDDLLKDLDARLDEERTRNEAAKADIVARAQALADHEPLADAMGAAKELQKEWEGIGITRQKRDRALWQSFRAACDAVFARRDDKRAEEQAQISEQLSAAESALGQLEQMFEEGGNSQAIEQSLRDFRELSLPARQRDLLNRRYEELRSQYQEMSLRSQRQQQKDQWLERLRAASTGTADTAAVKEICIRAEILAGLESPPEDQPQRMTLQVERLAAGMGQGQNFPDARAEMDHLLSLWQDNPPVSPEPALLARMEAAIETLQD